MTKVIFIPGNGGASPKEHWFRYLKKEFGGFGLHIIDDEFPDSELAREKYWIPFIQKLGADAKTILIGHSSGAVAAMRYAEKYPMLGSVLVSACYTDLGDEKERLSGYYDHPWDWEKIKKNQQWIGQFASTDDPWIPIQEARFIHEKLDTEYFEYTDQGHFGGLYDKETFPELTEFVKKKLPNS